MAQTSTLVAEDQGPLRIVVSGHMRGFEIVGQEAINEIIRRKLWGVVDSPFSNPAPHVTVTIEVDPDR